jgi:hypothetical protein
MRHKPVNLLFWHIWHFYFSHSGYADLIELLIHRFSALKIDHVRGEVENAVDIFNGFGIFQVNKLGQTALIKAAIQGRERCAVILLRAGKS